jgi:formylglycine-generating enzyme required for sulfatase activity
VRAPAPRRPTAGAVRWWAVTGARLALGAARALACAAPLLVACGEKQGAPSAERAAPSAELGALGSGVASATAAGPVASGSPPAARAGVCAGRAPGEKACEAGAELVCEASGKGAGPRACGPLEACRPGVGCAPSCPSGQVYVPPTGPAGFTMGKGLRGGRDTPHQVVLTQPFCMDATEVTVGAYKPCVDAGKCTTPKIARWTNYPDKVDEPMLNVDWRQARAYCEFRGQHLPSEAQWEWAATGGDGRKWPWGDEAPTCEHADFTIGSLPTPSADAGCHGGGPSKVGAHPKGDRLWPGGAIHDLAGNVWEWCHDNFRPYAGAMERDPVHMDAEGSTHVVRGGGWNRSAVGIMAAYRGGAVVDYQRPGLGFRCVTNAPGLGPGGVAPGASARAPTPSAPPAPPAPSSVK